MFRNLNSNLRYALALVKFLINPFSTGFTRENSKWNSNWSNFRVIAGGTVPISHLKVTVLGLGRVPIEKSPHFNFVSSNCQSTDYEEYIIKYYSDCDIKKQMQHFVLLYNKMKIDDSDSTILVRQSTLFSNELIVLDGVHRLAILAALGNNRISIKISF